MAELKKVADIKEKVVNVELPAGAAEKVNTNSTVLTFETGAASVRSTGHLF